MKANHHIKRFLFKYYALISVSVFVVAMLVVIHLPLNDAPLNVDLKWKIIAAIAAGTFAFAFGVQKQNLEETKLFKDLFEQFNKRYDGMNDELNQIHQQPPDQQLTEDEKKKLFKYFNLCGEEYLYFKKGFIYPKVWRAWKNGMEFFRQNTRIKKLWEDELGRDSYYGFKF